MKANEAPKSKFVYPDKLYARTNNNITLDISYAPQTLKAVEYTRTDAFIKKACEWIETNMDDYIHVEYDTVTGRPTNEAHIAHKKVVEDFKNAMKG